MYKTLVQPFPFRPGLTHGFYPEREESKEPYLERFLKRLFSGNQSTRQFKGVQKFVEQVNSFDGELKPLSDGGIDEQLTALRFRLIKQGLSEQNIAKAFALVRTIAHRTIGMRHFDTQVIGGWVIMNAMIAEMETGEGKTLTATLPAATAALAGIPVHVITVNDYLAARDAGIMKPLYHALGLTVGIIQESDGPEQRRAAYACDITYCANKQIAFDYLKDRLILGKQSSRSTLELERLGTGPSNIDRLVLRGLCFAIIDEADSVLVDEARTPLILSKPCPNNNLVQDYQKALRIAGILRTERDFSIREPVRHLSFTDQGLQRLKRFAEPLDGIWASSIYREEMVGNALKALHLFKRDIHYVIKDDKIQIIDEFTGRTMPDRSWNSGLHQMIEIKEGCEVQDQKETIARICYQRFFRRYLRLSGMTGTAMEVRKELKSVYRLSVVRVPTHKPVIRRYYPDTVFRSEHSKWNAIVDKVQQLQSQNRPVLVGTRSVAASELLSERLKAKGIEHQILNARQDQAEAEIVSRAGEPGRVTVATNMAGRGTDIKLSHGLASLGGLHVIVTERHEARRIDRQLFGRCARQGEPGSVECFLSLDDELFVQYCSGIIQSSVNRFVRTTETVPKRLAALVFFLAQKNAEAVNARLRSDLLKADKRLETLLAFSGELE